MGLQKVPSPFSHSCRILHSFVDELRSTSLSFPHYINHPTPEAAMKFLTSNFVKCAIKTCDSSTESFPLQFSDCQLVQEELDYNPDFIVHMLERLDWDAILKVAADLGNNSLPPVKPENLDPIMEDDQAVLKDLHTLLVETQIVEGKMTCRNCEHIYYIKNSIPNFLLPPHLC